MGYSLSWVAVKAVPQAVYAVLDVQPTGERRADAFRRGTVSSLLLGGRTVVVFGNKELKDNRLAAVSRVGETIHCFVEEHLMVSVASLWRDGKRVWRVTHDGQESARHLSTDGDVPPEFASIRDKYLAKQAAEPEEDVDHIFDIPVELARELTGYRHDQEFPDTDGREPFETLESSKKKKWWSLS
jgi:hypothetical protein